MPPDQRCVFLVIQGLAIWVHDSEEFESLYATGLMAAVLAAQDAKWPEVVAHTEDALRQARKLANRGGGIETVMAGGDER